MNETQVLSGRIERGTDQCLSEQPCTAREINIRPLNFGYIINVGCHSFAIETVDKLITNLSEYLKDPGKTEKKWFDTKSLS